MNTVEQPYYTVREVATILRKHPDTIRIWCEEGKLLGAQKFGRDWYIPRTTIDPPQITPRVQEKQEEP